MYCVKCRKKTDTTNEKLLTTSNNRTIKRGEVFGMWNNKDAVC